MTTRYYEETAIAGKWIHCPNCGGVSSFIGYVPSEIMPPPRKRQVWWRIKVLVARSLAWWPGVGARR